MFGGLSFIASFLRLDVCCLLFEVSRLSSVLGCLARDACRLLFGFVVFVIQLSLWLSRSTLLAACCL